MIDRELVDGTADAGAEGLTGARKASLIATIVLAGLAIALVYHGILRFVFDVGYPSDTFLFKPELRFSDWYVTFDPVQKGSPLGYKSIYFPFAYVPLYPLVWMSADAAMVVAFAVFGLLTFGFCWYWLAFLPKGRRAWTAAVLTFATYPFLFMIDRANIEIFVALFVFGFLLAFARGRYNLAAICLAAAIATKLFPGVMGVLLLYKKQYKAALLTAVLTVAMTLIPAALFPGGIGESFEALAKSQAEFMDRFVLQPGQQYFSLSYHSVLKNVVRVLNGDVRAVSEATHSAYVVFSIMFFVVIALFVYFRERTLWKQATCLCFTMLLLPEISYDYRLIHVLGPMMLFIATRTRTRDDRAYALAFALLLIPKAYAPIDFETTIGVVLNPMIMSLMIGYIMWSNFRDGGLSVPVVADVDAASPAGASFNSRGIAS